MLVTIRDYGKEALESDPDSKNLQERHSEYFRAFSEKERLADISERPIKSTGWIESN